MSMRVFSLHYIVFTKFTSSANIRFRSCSTWRCHASFSDPVKLVISSLNKFTLVAVKIAVEGLKMNYLMLDKKESLASLETRRGLERKCVPQLFLGLLLGTRQSSIGQCFSVVLSNSPEVIARVSFLFLKWRIKDLDSGLGESTTFQTFFMALIPLSPAYSKTNL